MSVSVWVTYEVMCQWGKGYSLWLWNSHEKEHPDATANCDDREFTDGLRGREDDASRRAGVGRRLPPLGHQALAEIIEGRMAEAVDYWLDSLDGSALRDRRNGSYSRHLLTELGDIALSVPRTRRFCPTEVLRRYARRAPKIDRAILAGFVLGLSTRKVGEVLLALLGRPVSAATVSRVARTLDGTVAAFHRRPLANAYKALMLDGVVLTRKTGAGALRRPVLVALGLRHDGRKESSTSASRPARAPPSGSAS